MYRRDGWYYLLAAEGESITMYRGERKKSDEKQEVRA